MRALILAGDHYHVAEHAFEGVGSVLKSEGIEVECTTDFAAFHKLLADKELLVIHRDGIEFPEDRSAGPVRWMQPEQEEAIEQLQEIVNEIDSGPQYSESEFMVQLGHAYHHVNYAWHIRTASRDQATACSEADFVEWSKFPRDEILEYV